MVRQTVIVAVHKQNPHLLGQNQLGGQNGKGPKRLQFCYEIEYAVAHGPLL